MFNQAMNKFNRSLDIVVYYSGLLGAFLLFLLGPIAFYEVIARKMGSPTIWAFHVLCYFQSLLIWFGLGYGQKLRAHISVDIFTRLLPLKLQLITRIVASFLSLILSIILTWQAWRMVYRSYTLELMTTEELYLPVYLLQLPTVIGSAILTLVFFQQILKDIQWLVNREGIPEGLEG
jgi:TRAP-type C4-dicarboxylate transport system permease small subunit